MVALRLDPLLVSRLVAGLTDGVVLVTGTNGKTSTCHMLRSAMAEPGRPIVANEAGSNLVQGIVTALVLDRDLRGRARSTMGVFEVDEAALGSVAAALSPRLVVVLNLFRDQLDRHAELDRVAAAIGAGLATVRCDVLLNADDVRVTSLAARARGRVRYFSLDRPVDREAVVTAADVSPCPDCGARLAYDWVAYAQLGRYECPSCGLRRPTASVAVTAAHPMPGGGWRVWVRAGPEHLMAETTLRGVYNVDNLVAAVAAAVHLGVPARRALAAVAACGPVAGRGSATTVGVGEVVVLLGKNPTGVAQVLQAYVCPDPAAPLLVVLNDTAADGRDVSWIWDAPFEALAGRTGPVLVAGTRAPSMLVRLEYAEVAAMACASVDAALDRLVALVRDGGRAHVLTTYSGVQPVDERLGRLGRRPVEAATPR